MEVITLAMLFTVTTAKFDLPDNLLSALCYTESHHTVTAVHKDDGTTNSLGVCQVKLTTAQMLGFKGTEVQLMSPKVNINYAGMYLSRQLQRYDGNVLKAVGAYNMGTYKENKAGLPINQRYLHKVFDSWLNKK